MQSIILQLERLRRHHAAALRNYDAISLLDLSHSLRIWADLKSSIHQFYPKFQTTRNFRSMSPARKLVKAARGHRHVIMYLHSGVVTYASKGQLATAPHDGIENMEIGCSVMAQLDGGVALRDYVVVYGEDYVRPEYQAMKDGIASRGNFQDWFGTEAVRICFLDESGEMVSVTLSKEVIIRRVANTLDGSHPSASQSSTFENRHDPAVHALMDYKVGGLPLPYFIIMKMAQDLVELAPSLME